MPTPTELIWVAVIGILEPKIAFLILLIIMLLK